MFPRAPPHPPTTPIPGRDYLRGVCKGMARGERCRYPHPPFRLTEEAPPFGTVVQEGAVRAAALEAAAAQRGVRHLTQRPANRLVLLLS